MKYGGDVWPDKRRRSIWDQTPADAKPAPDNKLRDPKLETKDKPENKK